MKSILPIVLLFTACAFAQVGVGTTTPTAALDINGDTRIRTIPTTSATAIAKDSVLSADKNGNVKRITSKMIIESHLKSFVKGGFTGEQSLTLAAGSVKIPFNYEEFDENDEFNTATSTFTAKAAGIYHVAIQVKTSAGISVASNLGVAILKNGVVVAREGFANIGITVIVTINVTPPVRDVETLLKLNAGDTVSFSIYSDLINIGLQNAKEDSFFTIHQVR